MAAIPDFVLLEKSQGFLFLHFHLDNIFRFLNGGRRDQFREKNKNTARTAATASAGREMR